MISQPWPQVKISATDQVKQYNIKKMNAGIHKSAYVAAVLALLKHVALILEALWAFFVGGWVSVAFCDGG